MKNPYDNAEEIRRTQAEFRLQLAVVKHLERAYPTVIFLHVPNRPGDAKDGFFKRAMGAKAGAPDLILWYKGGCAAIELKAPTGHIATAQNKILSALHSVGVKTAVCKSVRQVHDALKSWGLTPTMDGIIEPDTRSDMQKKHDAFEAFRP